MREAAMHIARLGEPVQDRQPVDRALPHAACGLRANGQRLHRLRHARGGVQREDLARPQQIAFAPQGGAQPHRRDAVAAEREEIVVCADALHSQQLGHRAANQPFLLGGRFANALRQRFLRFGQRLAVNLAVDVQRQLRHYHQDRRHHIIRQTLRKLPQQLVLQRRRGATRVILHRAIADQAIGGADRFGDHHRPPHVRQGGQGAFHLTQLDAEAAHLDLVIGPANEYQLALRAPAHQVAAAVHHLAFGERVGDKARRRQIRAAQVTARDALAGNVQLTRRADRHRLQAAVEQPD